jgi:flagellar assembly factor FliW
MDGLARSILGRCGRDTSGGAGLKEPHVFTDDLSHETWPADLDLPSHAIITFPHGLIGCEQWRRFALRSDDEAAGLHLLISLDVPDVQFFLLDPRRIDPSYRPVLSASELDDLGLQHLEEAMVVCILTPQPECVTANLAGPLVINPARRVGLQLLQVTTSYSTRHPVPSAYCPIIEP